MTTIVINEDLNIPTKFNSFFDFFKCVNNNIQVDIDELENQDNILKSEEYKNYDKILSNIKF